jgi:glycosyltransferase involved in cell wall biosynthesis
MVSTNRETVTVSTLSETNQIRGQMQVSVIVPNHGRDITRLKESLPKDVELIHIDRGLERSEQRNIGIDESNGKYLLFLDSDQSVSPGLIDECILLMQKGYSCVYIPEVIVVDSFFGKIRKFEREFYTGTAVDVPRFVRKDCCPYFDKRLVGPEDALFGSRIKGKKAISKECLYHHDDISLFEYISKKNLYGKSMAMYKKINPSDPCLNIWYRCVTVFVEKSKWRKLLCHPILSMGIVILLLLRSMIYFNNVYLDKTQQIG